MKELPARIKTIKLDVRTWDSLRSMKKANETFSDVVRGLIMERTKTLGNENIKAVKYSRNTGFFTVLHKQNEIGFEFEYNDVKDNKDDFVLDLKIKKVFFGKKVLNPSEFFGVDNEHKHYSEDFTEVYMKALSLALKNEFDALFTVSDKMIANIALWRKFYYEYRLSEESFKSDIEEPLRLNEDEKPNKAWSEKMAKSVLSKLE